MGKSRKPGGIARSGEGGSHLPLSLSSDPPALLSVVFSPSAVAVLRPIPAATGEVMAPASSSEKDAQVESEYSGNKLDTSVIGPGLTSVGNQKGLARGGRVKVGLAGGDAVFFFSPPPPSSSAPAIQSPQNLLFLRQFQAS